MAHRHPGRPTHSLGATLPDPWTLNDFDFTAQPGVDEKLIRDLATLRFLDDIGNPGYQSLWSALRATSAA
ncbi:ATP-binding protein [Streptomyces sp. NBC_01314]|uniref:ATP-binding protein n=1 Tax=Streptomyces sp. NBC_01314 TaxID=2903821 RepID=UPI00308ABE80|nr:ATP-binding protein [Streptomyces sp. NBC_01314]